MPVICRLKQSNDFKFQIIADKDPGFGHCSYEFISWNKQTEINDLLQFDIGLMPLPDTDLARGKCAFKAIQYMALGIPAVVSDVGANSEVVDDGVNGFVCHNEVEWTNALQNLLTDELLRARMGANARSKIVAKYSVEATTKLFVSLFQEFPSEL
jgi:glycosyltransferase involved in cell wall biosynthesis